MACLQVADEGDSLQIWKVADSIFNKQLWAANRGLGVGQRANTPHRRNQHFKKYHTGPQTSSFFL
jgi:hypothetical protein